MAGSLDCLRDLSLMETTEAGLGSGPNFPKTGYKHIELFGVFKIDFLDVLFAKITIHSNFKSAIFKVYYYAFT